MHLFRALYLQAFGLISLLISAYALLQLFTGQWLWVAVLLAWLPSVVINGWRRYRANIAFLDERESPIMLLAMVGLSICLLFGERGVVLWFTLAGLFGLLLLLMFATRLGQGLREPSGDSGQLKRLAFHDGNNQSVTLQDSCSHLVVFLHSGTDVYSRMAARALKSHLAMHSAHAEGAQVSVVFPDAVPHWAQELWGESIQLLSLSLLEAQKIGLGLRGGNGLRGDALRPTIAVVKANSSVPEFWVVAANLRLPPTFMEHRGRIQRLLK